jgi:hypothetical protein
MKRAMLYLATVALVAACGDQRAPTSPGGSLVPRDRSSVVFVGGGPLASGTCARGSGKPVEVSVPFSATAGVSATLTVTGGAQRLTGNITLNGVEVVSHLALGGTPPVSLSVPVTLAADNVLVCTLEGRSGAALSFQVQ